MTHLFMEYSEKRVFRFFHRRHGFEDGRQTVCRIVRNTVPSSDGKIIFAAFAEFCMARL